MAIDLLLKEAQGLSEDVILEVVRFIQFIKLEKRGQTGGAVKTRRELADKYAGKIKMSEDFDDPLEDFQGYM